VDGVDVPVLEDVGVGLVPPLDAGGVADLVELVLRPLADGDELGLRVPLVDGNELGPEAEAHDRGADAAGGRTGLEHREVSAGGIGRT
jgi:hypothetical protein